MEEFLVSPLHLCHEFHAILLPSLELEDLGSGLQPQIPTFMSKLDGKFILSNIPRLMISGKVLKYQYKLFTKLLVTCAKLVRRLPLGTLLRYKDLPMLAKIRARRTAIAHTPKPKSHPWLELIHTIIVTPSIAPMVMLNKNQLKKLDN